MTLVNLYDAVPGVLIPMHSGVEFTNQCGGTACFHPVLEGIYIPFYYKHLYNLYESFKDPFLDRVEKYEEYLLGENKNRLELFLKETELDELFMPIWLEEDLKSIQRFQREGKHWGEAWVPLKIKQHKYGALKEFIGEPCIVTYENSD